MKYWQSYHQLPLCSCMYCLLFLQLCAGTLGNVNAGQAYNVVCVLTNCLLQLIAVTASIAAATGVHAPTNCPTADR